MTSKEALYQLNEIALGSKSVKENNWYYRDIIEKDLEILELFKLCFYSGDDSGKNEWKSNCYINIYTLHPHLSEKSFCKMEKWIKDVEMEDE